jgi:hypothetical protein
MEHEQDRSYFGILQLKGRPSVDQLTENCSSKHGKKLLAFCLLMVCIHGCASHRKSLMTTVGLLPSSVDCFLSATLNIQRASLSASSVMCQHQFKYVAQLYRWGSPL